jgi:hypothetical protein
MGRPGFQILLWVLFSAVLVVLQYFTMLICIRASQHTYLVDGAYLDWLCLKNCNCSNTNSSHVKCIEQEIGFDIGAAQGYIFFATTPLSFLASIYLMWHAQTLLLGLQKKLILVLAIVDMVYSVKNFLEGLSLRFFSVLGTPGCRIFALADSLTSICSQGWTAMLILNLLLVVVFPRWYVKFSKSNALFGVFIVLVLCFALPISLGGEPTTHTIQVVSATSPCKVSGKWRIVTAYVLLFYYAWGAFAVAFTTKRLGPRLSFNPAAARVMLQLVAFILAFYCTWLWHLALILIPQSQIIVYQLASVSLADTISIGLVGFTNAVVWTGLRNKTTVNKFSPVSSPSSLVLDYHSSTYSGEFPRRPSERSSEQTDDTYIK